MPYRHQFVMRLSTRGANGHDFVGKLPDGSQRAFHKRIAGLSSFPKPIRPACSRRRCPENPVCMGAHDFMLFSSPPRLILDSIGDKVD